MMLSQEGLHPGFVVLVCVCVCVCVCLCWCAGLLDHGLLSSGPTIDMLVCHVVYLYSVV